MPTFINTTPKFTEMIPSASQGTITANQQYLSARRKPTMVTAYKECTFGMNVENNLLIR